MRYLILHGWQGSGDGHWQPWLAEQLTRAGHDVAFPTLPDPDHPRLEAWLAALEEVRGAAPPAGTADAAEAGGGAGGEIVLAHSLACVLWLHHRARGGAPAARVLLVAPAMPRPMLDEIAGFYPVPLEPELATGCRIVSAPDDPYCPGGAKRRFAKPLQAPHDCVPGGGHLNTDAGYGAWPAVLAWAQGAKNGVET